MVDTHNNDTPKTWGAYVKQQRERLGMSQRQLASKVGIHHSGIARLESDQVTDHPRPEYLQGIADALGVDVSNILRYLGVTPRPELPSVRTYFRRKLGVNADEAEILASLVADYQLKLKRQDHNN
jgi:transcriptional regulator with XRE-family HTH domain